MLLLRALSGIEILHRFRIGLMSIMVAVLCIGGAFLNVGCAHDDESSADSSQHRGHRHGGYGRSNPNPTQSATPIPGL